MRKQMLRRMDVIIIAAILLLALLIWLIWQQVNTADVLYAEVYYKNELIETIPMVSGEEKAFTFTQDDSITITRAEDGSVAFTTSDCPDQLCVQSGRKNRPYEFAACLPNNFLLSVVGEDLPAETGSEVDFVN